MPRTGEFPTAVRNLLRARAGEQCSHPTCNRSTVAAATGPGAEKTGKAAHILPASMQGPRSQFLTSFTGTRAALHEIDNGIWLCDNHAEQIDKNDGRDYPPFVLRAWKALHHSTVRLGAGGVARRVGWIHELTLKDTRFAPPDKYEFGPANLLIGNDSGKSAILNLLTASSAADVSTYSIHGAFEYTLRWFDPNLQTMEVTVPVGEAPTFRFNGAQHRAPPAPPIRVGNANSGLHSSGGPYSSIDEIAERTGVHPSDVAALISGLGRLTERGREVGPVAEARVDDGRLMIRLRGTPAFERRLSVLGGAEQMAIAVEIALARALTYSDGRPLVLVFDTWPTILQEYTHEYIAALLEHAGRVQIFATAYQAPKDVDLHGWRVFHLPPRQPRSLFQGLRQRT
jgi:hypothetical protein